MCSRDCIESFYSHSFNKICYPLAFVLLFFAILPVGMPFLIIYLCDPNDETSQWICLGLLISVIALLAYIIPRCCIACTEKRGFVVPQRTPTTTTEASPLIEKQDILIIARYSVWKSWVVELVTWLAMKCTGVFELGISRFWW